MSYNPNIPLVGDFILQSQGQLKANFQAINNAFASNHAGLTMDSSIGGMHNSMIMQAQGSDPTTSANEVAIYNKLVSTIPNLFLRPASDGTAIQMTYPSIKADSSNTQYSFVAGPFIIFGGYLANITQNQVVTLSPGTTLLYVDLVLTNIVKPNPGVAMQAVPTTLNTPANSFTIKFSPKGASTTYDAYYFAVGV